jgi:hypothetical protein
MKLGHSIPISRAGGLSVDKIPVLGPLQPSITRLAVAQPVTCDVYRISNFTVYSTDVILGC